MAKYYNVVAPQIFNGLGRALEEEVLFRLKQFFCKKGQNEAVSYTMGTQRDIHEGTDAVIYGVPVDVTYNLSKKDFTELLPESLYLWEGSRIRFGVRTGNSHNGYTPFDIPVLVIGVDGVDDFMVSKYLDNISDAVYKIADEIVELGQSQYWDWVDAQAC